MFYNYKKLTEHSDSNMLYYHDTTRKKRIESLRKTLLVEFDLVILQEDLIRFIIFILRRLKEKAIVIILLNNVTQITTSVLNLDFINNRKDF